MDGVSSAFRRLLGRGAAAERRILAAVPQAILTVDASECLEFANPTAATFLAEALGPERGDDSIMGRSLHGTLETIAGDGGRVCVLCAALGEGGDREGVATLRPGDWHIRYTCVPLGERDVRIGVVLTIERQATEAEIEQRVQARIAREMQALLADIAHELNNPLTVILASGGMLRDTAQSDETRRRVELIAEAAERCVGIIRTFRSSFTPTRTNEPVVAPAAALKSTPRPLPLPRAQILVVDDDALVASAMASALVAEGHEVDTASDGVGALARVATQRYDVILTDVRMPRLDGPGLYHELSRLRPELLSSVIFVTGDTLSPETRRFLESVSAPCVRKPFEPRQLRAAVRRLLAGGSQRDIA